MADCQLPSADCKLFDMNLQGIKLTWLGHATFRMETPAGKVVIVDPWVMGNPKCPEREKNIKKVDVLLCTHGHFDHIGGLVHHNHAAAMLLCGNYSAGLKEYEWRFKSRDYPQFKLSKPVWDGTPLEGRNILLEIRYLLVRFHVADLAAGRCQDFAGGGEYRRTLGGGRVEPLVEETAPGDVQ